MVLVDLKAVVLHPQVAGVDLGTFSGTGACGPPLGGAVEVAVRGLTIGAGDRGQLSNGGLFVADCSLTVLVQAFPTVALVGHVVSASAAGVVALAASPMVSIVLALKRIDAGLQCPDLRCIAQVGLLASSFGLLSNERWIAFDFSQCVIDSYKVPLMHVFRLDQVAVRRVGVQGRSQVLVAVSHQLVRHDCRHELVVFIGLGPVRVRDLSFELAAEAAIIEVHNRCLRASLRGDASLLSPTHGVCIVPRLCLHGQESFAVMFVELPKMGSGLVFRQAL